MSTEIPDYDDMSNRELLEAAAQLDEDKFAIAERAQAALTQLEESS
jgi:hypothetical protein